MRGVEKGQFEQVLGADPRGPACPARLTFLWVCWITGGAASAARARLSPVGSITWGQNVAEVYDGTIRRCSSPQSLVRPLTVSRSWREVAPPSSSPSAPDGWHCR